MPSNTNCWVCKSEVTEEAWKLKERESPLEEPPMFWLRGNRVYDFHGDRGTVAEFESDLLSREVEDDAACRSRRQMLNFATGTVWTRPVVIKALQLKP